MAVSKRSNLWANFWDFVLSPFSGFFNGLFSKTFEKIDFSESTTSQTIQTPSPKSEVCKDAPSGYVSLHTALAKERANSDSEEEKNKTYDGSQGYDHSRLDIFLYGIKQEWKNFNLRARWQNFKLSFHAGVGAGQKKKDQASGRSYRLSSYFSYLSWAR